MDYITAKEAAGKWGITDRMVLHYCVSGRIDGAMKMGKMWIIPNSAIKPQDKRYKNSGKTI